MLTRLWPLRAALALSTAAVVPSLVALPVLAQQSRPEVHAARGVIKSVDPERRNVVIAHEAIPGFMGAMTMSFEASPKQLGGLAPGDRVRFSFLVTEDGRRMIDTITRDER